MGAVAMALPFFALTLFVSAFLLFLVQPIIGKLILPRLGGTPQVWNTCMVFFQTALLAGYAYTHFVSTRLKIRSQLLVHGVLLLLPLLMLFGLGSFYDRIADFRPVTGGNPIAATMWLLFILVFPPFFVVATSAPLLQKWFAHTGHPAAKDPYFLYGASNLGSFLSLIIYPFILERILGLSEQAWTWSFGYAILVACVFGCVYLVMTGPAQVTLPREKEAKAPALQEAAVGVEKKEEVAVKAGPPPAAEKVSSFKKGAKQFKKGGAGGGGGPPKEFAKKSTPERREEHHVSVARPTHDPRLSPVTPLRRLRWIGLAAVPSSLMLGVTTYATTDLSPIPLLWLIPLMLYLLSFILVFAKWPTVWVEKPHDIFVKIQPFTIAALILALIVGTSPSYMWIVISIHIIAFFVTTMVCHGELAKDRPATEHLTEFYLLMSVGGMLGGMFNGLLAPVLFTWGGIPEYGMAIFFSSIMRPRMNEVSWMDQFFEGILGGGKGGRDGAANAPLILDIALPIAVFVLMALLTFLAGGVIQQILKSVMSTGRDGGEQTPFIMFVFALGLLCSILFMERPLRYGLTIGGILLIQAFALQGLGGGRDLHNDRSYFGVIRVREGSQDGMPFTNMIHGTTDHGMNFRRPADPKNWGDAKHDFSRLATTYYHRKGPAGRVMELFNWFPGIKDNPGKQNYYYADFRMPANIFGTATAMPLGFCMLPPDPFTTLWTEPPFATIGLGTGTMASYGRPFQHMHYYEIDKSVLRLSIPGSKGPFYRISDEPLFTYLRDAKERGVELWVLMGDARLRMAQPYGFEDLQFGSADQQKELDRMMEDYHKNKYNIMVVDGTIGGGPDNFYHMMVVDAFSSDAIPVHLITKEAIQMYFTKLTEDGVLCVHTSNKYINLVPVVADVAKELMYKDPVTGKETPYVAWRGHDNAPGGRKGEEIGHYTSEWVMVARKQEYLERKDVLNDKVHKVLDAPIGYDEMLRQEYKQMGWDYSRVEPYWKHAQTKGWPTWTDNYSNVIAAIRWPGSERD